MHDQLPTGMIPFSGHPPADAGASPEETIASARHCLIILGIVCQGFSFDTIWMPILYGAIGWICLRSRRQRALGRSGETALLLAGIAIAYVFGGDYGYNRLVFVGNALVFYQALLLLRPLNEQEKIVTVIISFVHLSVGSQVIANYAFALVFALAAVLLPRTLADLHRLTASLPSAHAGTPGASLSRWHSVIILISACLFFMLCPRLQLLPAAGTSGLVRSTDAEELELADGGGASADRLLFRVAGDEVRYIKRTALDEWDGKRWTQSFTMLSSQNWHRPPPNAPELHRQVTLLDAARLGNTVPVDGYVTSLSGTFFQRPYLAEDGSVRIAIALRRNVSYSYSSIRENSTEHLSERLHRHYLKIPPQTAQLTGWLRALTANDRTDLETVNTLATHFQDNFTYEIGAPRLRENTPVEAFVFTERRGHCSRFAATAAVLLRMKGIPSRVGLGWAPTERNTIGDFYNVRSRHAHAWAEAWIKGRGWVICDGTPYGANLPNAARSLRLTLAEWIEYVWYSKIVEFDTREGTLLGKLFSGLLQGVNPLSARRPSLRLLAVGSCVAIAAALALTWLLRRRKTGWSPSLRGSRTAVVTDAEARGFYQRMLRTLERRGHTRPSTATPMEFLNELERRNDQGAPEIRLITDAFIRVRYGMQTLPKHTAERIRRALAALSKHS